MYINTENINIYIQRKYDISILVDTHCKRKMQININGSRNGVTRDISVHTRLTVGGLLF
jgi:hypothetical protein